MTKASDTAPKKAGSDILEICEGPDLYHMRIPITSDIDTALDLVDRKK